MTRRTAFFISDSTGITAENLGRTLLTQFEFLEFNHSALRFINTPDRAEYARCLIEQAAEQDGHLPLVFSTLLDSAIRATLQTAPCVYLDLFDKFINHLEHELGVRSQPVRGHSHGLTDHDHYFSRMDAINYTLSHDDGCAVAHLDEADIIMLGVSRTGKTPTCLYLSLHYGVRAANFPITEDDLDEMRLPKVLLPRRAKLFGLTTEPQRLQKIRQERLPNSRYASLKQCEYEVRQAEALYRKLGIPCLSTTLISIEEIAATIVDMMGIECSRSLPTAAPLYPN
jgi:regulator of PEP synthase PpsR (kinase-PPPase family)